MLAIAERRLRAQFIDTTTEIGSVCSSENVEVSKDQPDTAVLAEGCGP